MKKVYIIIEHCRGRKEVYQGLAFSTKQKAEEFCKKENARPEPSMGWGSSYSYVEWEVK